VGGKWKLGRGDRKLTPYNLPDLRAAEVVIITEGEKKADVLGYQGLLDQNGNLVAITCTGSANSWKPELVDYFRGKKVLVFPDADEPGRRYCEAVTGSLKHANVQYDVVDFSGYGHDVRDFLRDHSAAELVEYISSDWLKPLATAETVPVNPYHYI
jgi:DNA primase